MKNLRFDGDLWSYFSMELVNLIILFFTIGIGMPWVLVRRYRWESRHTLLEGKKFSFEGEALELLGRWIIWWLLTLITFGIYSAIVRVKILEWRINHTVYLDN